ncbi:MAG: adenylate/guanylate cyclase domain-containing protein, partial [Candidatus Zixiibacteriota bacterium]
MTTALKEAAALIPYIPQTLADWYARAADGSTHTVTEHEGTVACVDASGFTALTRQFSEQGKEGPELLTTVLNSFFESMTTCVFQHGGDVLKFAGDAFWAFFPSRFSPGAFFQDILDALDRVNQHPYLSDLKLSVHIGAEYGRFHLVSLGDPKLRLEAEPCGTLLKDVFKACDTATTNSMLVGPVLADRCGITDPCPDDNLLYMAAPHPSPPGYAPATECHPQAEISPDCLVPYIPVDIVQRMSSAGTGAILQSEHREVAVLFANFDYTETENSTAIGQIETVSKGDDTSSRRVGAYPPPSERQGQALPLREDSKEGLHSLDVQSQSAATHGMASIEQALSERMYTAFRRIRKLGGNIARIDPYLSGHKLLVLFGAPAKGKDDELAALKCAQELVALSDDCFQMRVGLAFGPLFCGDVGSSFRREYTVMGDTINRAARLMSKAAWTEILMGSEFHSRLPDVVHAEKILLSLKGIGNEVSCCRLIGIKEGSAPAMSRSDVVGQHEELNLLQDHWETVRQGSGVPVLMTGVAGVGKTTLLHRFVSGIETKRSIIINCRGSLLFGRGWLARKILQSLVASTGDGSSVSLTDLVEKHIEPQWRSLLNDILGSGY